MEYTPRAQTRRAVRCMWVFFACGAACFLAGAEISAGRAVLQLAGIVFAVGGIYIAGRYLMTSFTYAVVPKGGGTAWEGEGELAAAAPLPDVRCLPNAALDFTVRKTQGRRAAVLDACFAMEELRYFAPLPREGGREREPYRLYPEMRVFQYTVSFSHDLPQYMAVFVDGEGQATGLVLEPDGEMTAYLEAALRQNGAQDPRAEE